MTWVKLDVSYLRNPKVRGLCSDKHRLLHLASILWTAEHLTDGYVPASALPELCQAASIGPSYRVRAAQALVRQQLWEQAADGWIVHDFAEWNAASTREEVQRRREQWRQRQRRRRDDVTP